ncbi:unnamed protein product [Nezara viridula]|uniref:Alpha-aspartyl dipeptidase n=1 Tax=Nezara viridula TaxID=85310 RepID=A0A9P0MQY6_NEZVI|nr:unnamed protein product [Nezara viridula]
MNALKRDKRPQKSLSPKFSVSKVLFIPYASKHHDEYTSKVKNAFNKMGVNLSGIHTSKDPVAAVGACQAIFIGGGNTFRLLKALYDFNLIEAIKNRVLLDGIPYIGASAGTNVATVNICTTNDMPIVFPPSFDALGLVPFNINPHYLEHEANSKHMGETRDQRIKEYHEISGTPVVGLKEGSLLFVDDDSVILEGLTSALEDPDANCQNVYTYGYGYRKFYNLPQSSFQNGKIVFNFSLAAVSNGHVLFSEQTNVYFAYEVVLGAGGKYMYILGATAVPEQITPLKKLRKQLLASYDPYAVPASDIDKMTIDTSIELQYISLV